MKKDFFYIGFLSPNTTPVPDDIFDVIAPELTEAELRVLLYVVRRTFGFSRERDAISLSQMVDGITTRDGRVLDRGTGMSRRGVMKGCVGLIDKGIIHVEKRLAEQGDNEINIYSLRFREEQDGTIIRGVGNKVPYGREQSAPGVGNEVPPQETVIQETGFKPSNIRKRSHADFSVDNSATQAATLSRNGSVERESTAPHTNLSTSVENGDTGFAPVNEWGMEALGDILKKGRGRPSKQYGEERQMILAFIGDFAREFSDKAELRSSVSRAYNIYKESGLSPAIFQDRLYQARAKTKENRPRIRTSPMAYFFACLEDEAGIKDGEYQLRAQSRHPS